jgi:pantoate--beta-alanine ligase
LIVEFSFRFALNIANQMEIVSLISGLQEKIRGSGSRPVGLVPTMGALHNGHLMLVREAMEKCPLVVVSIFVNPTQFNDKNDLRNYPRKIESDLELLGSVLRKGDLAFIPDVKEIYPEEDKRQFHFGNLNNVMEALHRPGHFNGVAQVVSRLFEITDPDYAFFGLKDFQQLAVIKELVRQLKFRVQIVPFPIVREKDGLAMSSRNALLEPEIRKNAAVIFETLSKVSSSCKRKDIPELKSFVFEKINSIPGFEVEYFEIADDKELLIVKEKAGMVPGRNYYGCIAVKAGKIRLIDNIELKC